MNSICFLYRGRGPIQRALKIRVEEYAEMLNNIDPPRFDMNRIFFVDGKPTLEGKVVEIELFCDPQIMSSKSAKCEDIVHADVPQSANGYCANNEPLIRWSSDPGFGSASYFFAVAYIKYSPSAQ